MPLQKKTKVPATFEAFWTIPGWNIDDQPGSQQTFQRQTGLSTRPGVDVGKNWVQMFVAWNDLLLLMEEILHQLIGSLSH